MSSPAESPAQILLADNDDTLMASAQRVLQRRGFRVTLASDGEQALARFGPQFHVVIACVELPKRDGLSLWREIKSRAPETQIIFLTDASSVSTAMMGLKEGAFAYLLKPISDYLQLTHAVERALELSKLRASALQPPPALTVPARTEHVAHDLRKLLDTFKQPQAEPKLLSGVVKSAAQIFKATKAVILFTQDSQPLELVAGVGAADQSATAREFMRVVGEEFAWRIAKERRTLTVSPSNKNMINVGTPLMSRGQMIGVLIVYEIPQEAVDPERLAWLESYAAFAGAAVDLGRLDDANARLAPNDPVTGALKENYFLEISEREFRRSWRFTEPLSVIHVSIVGLKEFNQRSQEIGERALRIISDICRQSVRNIDLIARLNDDSLVLLLLMTDTRGAQTVAERVARAAQLSSVEDGKEAKPLSVNLGVVTYPHEGCTSILDLIEIARTANSKASKIGRKQIVLA